MAFDSISDLWNKWNIRGVLILSLSFQVFLILCAPIRKKISNPHIIFLLWLAYLMADWVAAFGIGLISHSQGNLPARVAKVDIALQALWASFLLLHLGGPDTITAFSLEDSSLWRRHLFSLIFQVGVSIYVFVQIFPSNKSLMIPTILIFLAGVIKNAERTLALYLSSLSRLRLAVPFENELRFTVGEELETEIEVLECESSNEEKAKLAESIVVKHGYFFFKMFNVVLSDLFFQGELIHQSRKYLHKVCAVDALRVISVKLNFMYDMLYTKVLAALRSKWSYIFRFIAFANVAMAFVLFNHFKKHQLAKLDVAITYILLFGGIALDVITLFILVFSDWTIAETVHYKTKECGQDSFLLLPKIKLRSFLHKLISATFDLRKPRFATCKAESSANATYTVLDTPFIFRRWSESISACNIFSEFLKENLKKMYKCNRYWGINACSDICSPPFHMAEKIISLFHQTCETFVGKELSSFAMIPRYTTKNPFINKLWIFIFEEVRRKSVCALNPIETRKIYEARGDLFLQGRPGAINLLEFITKPNFDVSVISWHIATEICYRRENPTERKDEREFGKIISDYMLYLLLNQYDMMSAVAGFAQLHIHDLIMFPRHHIWKIKDMEELGKEMDKIATVELSDWTNPSLLGIKLAQRMESFGERKWNVMSGVWVEMLSYTAGHIKGEAHVKVLSKGGELLAFVWLLMTHFGCLYKPEWGTFESEIFGMEAATELDDDNGDQAEDGRSVVTQLV